MNKKEKKQTTRKSEAIRKKKHSFKEWQREEIVLTLFSSNADGKPLLWKNVMFTVGLKLKMKPCRAKAMFAFNSNSLRRVRVYGGQHKPNS